MVEDYGGNWSGFGVGCCGGVGEDDCFHCFWGCHLTLLKFLDN